MNLISHYIKVMRTDRYLRLKILNFNIYFSKNALRTRPNNGKTCRRRTVLKERLLKEKGSCQCCGKPLTWEESSVHHIVPRSVDKTREFDYSNLQLLCVECHRRLHRIGSQIALKAIDDYNLELCHT